MANLNDMPEIDDLEIREGGYQEANVKVSGIDIKRLHEGKDSQFEVNLDDLIDEGEDQSNSYFDRDEVFSHLNYECNDVGGSDDEDSTPFEKMKKKMVDLTGDGGVMKAILKHGSGPVVPPGSLCRVHYNGYFEYNDEPFDSSRLRGKQHQFKLGGGEVLLGWEYGISTMKRGELARFMMQPRYAYGEMGCPPRIPQEAVALFEIELISFVDQGAVDEFTNFSEEERKNASFDQILQAVDSLRKTGNEAFSLNQIRRASTTYMRAIRLLENANLKNDYEELQMKESVLKLYLNMAICDLKEAKSGRACKYARKALDIDPKNVKALFRFARALHQLGELEDAKKQIYKAHKLMPGNTEVMKELRSLDAELSQSRRKDKALSRKMLNLNALPKKENIPPERKTTTNSHMLKVVLDRLKMFKENEELPEMRLPSTLTEDEIENVKCAVKALDMYTSIIKVNDQSIISVSKSKPQE